MLAMPAPFAIDRVRADFPILKTLVRGKPFIYLDSAASAQKPSVVLDTMHRFYSTAYSNVHRGIYTLSEEATDQFENVRKKVQQFIGAERSEEIVFTRGATEAINLVAQSYLKPRLQPGDEILLTQMEHHANIVPWQQLCEQTKACIKIIPLKSDGMLEVKSLESLITDKTRFIALTHLSNVLGIVNPIQTIIQKSHTHNIPVLIDGSQAVAHLRVDMKALDCDFYVFSSHKMYGPGGVGVLYGKYAHLREMPPWQTGGGMIRHVSFERTHYANPPHRFEAGTPAVTEAIGLGAAIDYLNALHWPSLIQHEQALYVYAMQALRTIPGMRLLTEREGIGALSFHMDGLHAHDIATIVNESGIAIRAGHHCAMPLMEWLGVPATVRMSFGMYNDFYEVDALINSLRQAQALLN